MVGHLRRIQEGIGPTRWVAEASAGAWEVLYQEMFPPSDSQASTESNATSKQKRPDLAPERRSKRTRHQNSSGAISHPVMFVDKKHELHET